MSFSRKFRKLVIKVVIKAKRVKDFALHRDPIDSIVSEVRKGLPEPALENRVVVITGSTQGIGFVLAEAFLQKGARVVINGRRADVLQAAAIRLGNAERVLAVCADVSTAPGAQALLEQSVARFGSVDLLINNAAIMGPKDCRAWEISAEQWADTLTANLSGPFLCATAFMRWMVGAGVSGRIINVSSGAANAPIKGLLPYAVSKAALESLVTIYGLETSAISAIRTHIINPGATRTAMRERAFPGEDPATVKPPEDVAAMIVAALQRD